MEKPANHACFEAAVADLLDQLYRSFPAPLSVDFEKAFAAAKLRELMPDKAIRLLEQQGYKDIAITGWRPFMAGKDDAFSTGFEATAPNGSRVSGAVTGGFFKGSTARFD